MSQDLWWTEKTPEKHLSKQFHATNNNIVLEKILPLIPPVSIICSHFLEKHMWHTYPRTSSRLKQTGKNCRSICPQSTDSGKSDSADCGCIRRVFRASGCYGYDWCRASHVHAWCGEAGKQNCYHDDTRKIRGRFSAAADFLADGEAVD